MRIYTVGHSNRTLEELIGLLQEHQIRVLADVRSFPVSTRFPHFAKENLERRLPEANVDYCWLGRELGGFRKRKNPASLHTAILSPGFRNYADHTASEDFHRGLEELKRLAENCRVALMCAEKFWWRCHRRFISDSLVACCGVEVLHIVAEGKSEAHRLTPAARLAQGDSSTTSPNRAH